MTRDEMLEPIVQSIRQGTSYSRGELERFFGDWILSPYCIQDCHVGTFAFKGTEIHFAFVRGYRPPACWRGAIKAHLQPHFDKYGFLTTRVPHDRPLQKDFVKRVGFRPTWQDDNVEYFMLSSMPFQRNAT